LERGLTTRPILSEPLPGFLIPPEEQGQVHKVLTDLYAREVRGKSFRARLEECGKG